jgi:membrane protease YdiL (CAAX protease family)
MALGFDYYPMSPLFAAYKNGVQLIMENLTEARPLHPFISTLIFVATLFLGFVVIGPIVGFFLALPFYDGGFVALANELTSGELNEAIRIPYWIMQGAASGIGLIVVPMLAYQFVVKMEVGKLMGPSPLLVFGLTVAAVIVFIVPNSMVIEWNAKLEFTGPFWTWAKQMEARGEKLIEFLTAFKSFGEFIGAFFIIAILASVGEEFAFRGWLQPALLKASGNAHVAIWTSAILFSAFHFQFFGFVPRMLLGAMFGYLMHWSNNLWVPILAHFVNNGFLVVMMYLHQLDFVAFDAESSEALPLRYVIPFALLFIFLMMYLKKITQPREATS